MVKDERDTQQEPSSADTPEGQAGCLVRGPAARTARRRRRFAVGALALVVLVVLAFGIDRAVRQGEVLRGVAAAGVKLSGLDRTAALRELRALGGRLRAESMPVVVDGQRFELDPTEVGFSVDVERTADGAMAAGRQGNLLQQLGTWLSCWFGSVAVPVVGSLDEAKLEQVASAWEQKAIEDPPFEGGVAVRGDRLLAEYPRGGRGIDREALAPLLADALATMDRRELSVPLRQSEPRHGREAVDAAVREAAKLVDGPVELVAQLPPPSDPQAADGKARDEKREPEVAKKRGAAERSDENPAPDADPTSMVVRFSERDLLGALRHRSGGAKGHGLDPYFDAQVVDRALVPVRAKLEHGPIDASFVMDKGDRVRIVPSRPAALIDAEQVAAALLRAARSSERRGTLPVREGDPPKLTTEQAQALGIKTLVSSYTTRHACCQPRVKNIHRIAAMLDGTIIGPGERFSVNEAIGPRTTKKGFVLAPTIEEGEMADSVGGGISQFATTLFNAVLRGGYEVLFRAAHTIYFKRYPMGFDATLSYPEPDLVFRNDSEAGLLIKTVAAKTSITVKLFGDNGGRKVKTRKGHPTDIRKPPIKYLPNAELDPDEEEVKYGGKVGWTVHVSRTVEYADGTETKQRRKITYRPRPKELEVHPCRIPKRHEGYTGRPCPKPAGADEEEEESAQDEEPKGDGSSKPDKPKPDKPKPKPKKPKPKKPSPTAEPEEPPTAVDLIPPDLVGEGDG